MSMQQHKEGEQSRKIAAQLSFILDVLRQARSESTSDILEESDDEVLFLMDELRRTRRIRVNAPSPRPQLSKAHKGSSNLISVRSGPWAISLMTKILESRTMNGQLHTETYSTLNLRRGLSAPSAQGPTIAAFFGTRHFEETTTINPIVFAYNKVSSGSEVFKLVEDDDLDGFMRLLATGEASVRDCDARDRSLLHHACHHASVNICKFLVECGADVDRMNRLSDRDCSMIVVPLRAFREDDQKATVSDLERSLTCRKLLLQAGADPTSCGPPSASLGERASALVESLGDAFSFVPQDPLDLILREGSLFFNVRSYREQGISLWLHACRSTSSLTLKTLLRAGVDVADTDSIGWNCLFYAMYDTSDPSHSDKFHEVCFLLTLFDDIFAVDVDGLSVFDHVVRKHCPYKGLGSYHEDFWYCALYRSGLAARFNIEPPSSPPVFDRRYSARDYRALLYLNNWDFYAEEPCDDVLWEPDEDDSEHPLADHFPSSSEEREQAPAFGDWDILDLLMMEERAALTARRSHDPDPASSDEWETESDEEESDHEEYHM